MHYNNICKSIHIHTYRPTANVVKYLQPRASGVVCPFIFGKQRFPHQWSGQPTCRPARHSATSALALPSLLCTHVCGQDVNIAALLRKCRTKTITSHLHVEKLNIVCNTFPYRCVCVCVRFSCLI